MTAADYADRLVTELRAMGAEVPDHFGPQFLRYAGRLGPDNHADLGAMVVTECLELKRDGRPLDADVMRRLLDRIRKRLTRELKGFPHVAPLGDRPAVDSAPPVEQRVIDRETLAEVFDSLSLADLQIIDLLLSRSSAAEAAQAAGISHHAFRQRVSRIRHALRERVDLTADPG